MKLKSFRALAWITAAGAPLVAHSTVYKVPQQHPTIQAAIDVAVNGDTIRVAPGTYAEHPVINGKAISLIGADAATTVIDGGGSGRVLTVVNSSPGVVTIAGLTLRNGVGNTSDQREGGGLYVNAASSVVRDNVITNNAACAGTGIAATGGSIRLLRNRIVSNTALNVNGCGTEAMSLRMAGESFVERNVIANNQTAGGQIVGEGKVWFRHNVVRDNVENSAASAFGWGGLASGAPIVVEDNLFAHNSGSVIGGAHLYTLDTKKVIIRGNSFVGNIGSLAAALTAGAEDVANIEVSSNLFNESTSTAEIDCFIFSLQIDKTNVFASDTNPPVDVTCNLEQ